MGLGYVLLFYPMKNHKIAHNLANTEAREKINTDLES
jgi:hypothetical protein